MKLSTHTPEQIEEIQHLFTITFSDSAGQEEGVLIGKLAYDLLTITDSNDFYCFVATDSEQIVGSIIFSRLMFRNKISAFLLGPVAIHTGYQGKGIGQKLLNYGLSALKQDGVELAFTYGDPGFYSKVGFSPISEEVIPPPLQLQYPEGWLCQSLVSDEIAPTTGNSYYVEAINKPEYW